MIAVYRVRPNGERYARPARIIDCETVDEAEEIFNRDYRHDYKEGEYSTWEYEMDEMYAQLVG